MSGQIITVVGGDLFSLAARCFGDATQWIRIAQANQLRDYVLSGTNIIVLPPNNPGSGDSLAK